MRALQSAFNAQGQVPLVWVRLTSPAAFKQIDAALKADPRLNTAPTVLQPAYYANQVGFLVHFTRGAAIGIAVILGLGAILAIVNALALALAGRRGEIAVRRAVGFRPWNLSMALMAEVPLLALICAGIAIAFGLLALNGHAIESSNFHSSFQFRLQVTPWVIGWTFIYTVILGVLASLWPIARAVRAPLTKTLQDE